jgi:hypothetical protein
LTIDNGGAGEIPLLGGVARSDGMVPLFLSEPGFFQDFQDLQDWFLNPANLIHPVQIVVQDRFVRLVMSKVVKISEIKRFPDFARNDRENRRFEDLKIREFEDSLCLYCFFL